jgi:2,3-dihydroxybiphenyl 1,2-dioxygenase
MEITGLGYVGVRARHVEDWNAFATGLLGMQQVDRGGGQASFRMDDRKQRLVVEAGADDGLGFMGWEVADAAALQRLAARLDAADAQVTQGDAALAGRRRVAALIVFHDPAGNRLEAFYGAEAAADPFMPGRPISGFKTGPQGMGHVVLNVVDVDALLPFYRDILGFRITDFGLHPYKLFFFHVNSRHHSFAMVGSGRSSLHHFMVEMTSLDDVGQGYDLALLDHDRIAYTLGRHTNDYMTSFYAKTPSGFFVEYGWGARVIDPGAWEPHETFDGPSFWGHERLYLPEAPRTELRRMRLDAAARGVRAQLPADPASSDSVIAQE